MPAILTLTVIVVLVLVVALFIRDAKQAQQRHAGTGEDAGKQASDVVSHHEAPSPPQPPPVPDTPPVDTEELAEHVRGLRHAVDRGLIGRDEAVGSIVRQAGGGIGDDAAAKLLDGAAEPADQDNENDRGGEAPGAG